MIHVFGVLTAYGTSERSCRLYFSYNCSFLSRTTFSRRFSRASACVTELTVRKRTTRSRATMSITVAVSATADSANGPQTVVRQTAELNGDAAVFEHEKDRHEQVPTYSARGDDDGRGFYFFFFPCRGRPSSDTRTPHRCLPPAGMNAVLLYGPSGLSLGVLCARSYN